MFKLIVLLFCINLSFSGCYTIKINDLARDYSREPTMVQINNISVDYTIKNDLSISWKYKPIQKFKSFNNESMFIEFELITIKNTSIYMFLTMFANSSNEIEPNAIIKALVRSYPEEPKYIKGKIKKYNENWTEGKEWIFYIDISKINLVLAGEKMKPGIFTRFEGQWVPETITLNDGQYFKKNAYYLITSNTDNKENYSYAIFKSVNKTEIIHNENGLLNLYSGGLYLENMRLREILINGNNHEGFNLTMTPESDNIFIVKIGSVPKY